MLVLDGSTTMGIATFLTGSQISKLLLSTDQTYLTRQIQFLTQPCTTMSYDKLHNIFLCNPFPEASTIDVDDFVTFRRTFPNQRL